jgi:hypothetical protein
VGEVEEVSFVQWSRNAFVHRDALRFANGRSLLLQRLSCGQRVDVLSLGEAEEQPATADEAMALARVPR